MEENSLTQRLRGRAAYLRDNGEVKSPGLMEDAADEIERLQRIIDSRPAINAGLPETYIQWSQGVMQTEQQVRELLATGGQPAETTKGATNEVTVLPDGSAFAVYSYPLPKGHWLYAPREYEQCAEEPKELAAPILTHAAREQVVSAIRYAVRAATDCGKETDFDPDALVQNAVYALCGPFNKNQPQPSFGRA